jgi:Zn-dependent protease
MDPTHVINIVFLLIVLLFSVSFHESAHAWTAWKLGDPTAYMLGRITLNPVKHIDPLGSIVVPLVTAFFGYPFGWAKPTPVNTRNFKRLMRDDILTSVAGPTSNFILAFGAVIALKVITMSSAEGLIAVNGAVNFVFSGGKIYQFASNSNLNPISILLTDALYINVILAIFNLIPIPPLDGSHVIRHLLPDAAVRVYDSLGIIGIILFFTVGSSVLGYLAYPVLRFFLSFLG